MNRITPDALYELLPAVHRLRDADEGEPLRQLISVLAREGAVVEENIEQLFDNLFIETCAPWAVPYIGGTIGYRTLYQVEGLPVGNRSEVAHLIGYRRRKGTAAVLEQLARDVTGWPARVVEYFERVATCQHMNHIRPDHHATPDLHDPLDFEALGGAFDYVTRSIDVRSIEQSDGRSSVGGRHNLPNVGLHLWRLLPFTHTNVPTTRIGPRRFLFDPLGAPRQLVNRPEAEESIRTLAQPVNVPGAVTRRALHADPALYYPRAFEIFVNNAAVPVEDIVACDLSNDGAVWNHSPHVDPLGPDVRVDPELGRIAFRNANPGDVRVTYRTAFPALIGGGEYNRAADLVNPPGLQMVEISDPTTDLDAELAQIQDGGVLVLTANEVFTAPTTLTVDSGAQVIVRAADGVRPILRATQPLLISGGADARVTLDGLTLDGVAPAAPSVSVDPDPAGEMLTGITLRHMTLIPGQGFTRTGAPVAPEAVSLAITATGVEVLIDRSVTGRIEMADTVNAEIRDSIVDAAAAESIDSAEVRAIWGLNSDDPAGALTIIASTVIGQVFARAFPLVSDSILFARSETDPPVRAMRRQEGCMRFSFVPRGSITPRRYRCQPQLAIDQAIEAREIEIGGPLSDAERDLIAGRIARWLVPVFTALSASAPAYAQLHLMRPREIARGASDESEMGVYHQLFQPQRETNLRLRLEEFLRFGLEAGLFFET
ncbi:hypothetical protein HW561_20950 [Rhodobacteraceae bacterium B1Z28]|uniref:Tail protein P2 I n=1 Tax=Ruegeria haliotis TaxID=2747601 RepID=A0ABX2PVP1_9RHOB|nr:hypothetical protein [Ruegeria haliotis]NVO58258.1 hypothetical protein [Ruegeria haliotis]